MNTERFALLRRNKFYLFWCRFFVDLNALNAVIQLFYLDRGVTPSQIYLLGIAFSLGALLFDVPSSFLADRWGRKNTITLGVIFSIIANFGLFFAYGFWSFFINTFILAISYSFFFGVEDAFLYDTLKEMKQEKVVLKTAGKYASAGRISKIITPLLGAIIVKDLVPSQFNILILINFVSSCLALFFVAGLTEPKRFIEKYKQKLEIFKDGLTRFIKTEALRTFALNKTLIFVASFVFWRFYQKELLDLGFSVLFLGLIYPVSNALLVIAFLIAPKINKIFKEVTIFNGVAVVSLVSSILFVFTEVKILLYFCSIILLTAATVRDPFFTQQIQWRLKSESRATTSSILGLIKNLTDIPILLLSGYLATFGGRWVMVLPIALSFATITFFRIKQKHIQLDYNYSK